MLSPNDVRNAGERFLKRNLRRVARQHEKMWDLVEGRGVNSAFLRELEADERWQRAYKCEALART